MAEAQKKSVNSKYRGKLLSAYAERSGGALIPYGISTQSLALDIAIGCPGIPGAKLTQLWGLDGTGKSTLMTHLIAECQKMGGTAVLFDTEAAYDLDRASVIGVDLKNLQMAEPENLEELLDMMVDYSTEYTQDHDPVKEPLLFIVDSADGMPTATMSEYEADDSKQPALAARCWNANIPRLMRIVCKKNRATIVVVCQQYTKIGERTFPGMPPPMEVKGGMALKFRAHLRIEIKSRTGQKSLEEKDGKVVGYTNVFKTWKNKSSAPWQEAHYRLTFDSGIDKYTDLLEVGIEHNLIQSKSGGTFAIKTKTKEIEFKKGQWNNLVDRLGGPDKVRASFTKKLIREGVIRPYGVNEDGED